MAEDEFYAKIMTALIAVITVIGPSNVVLTGSMFTEEIYGKVCAKCKELLPAEFLPQFALKTDASDDYLNGVINMALDSMSYNIRLIAN